MNTLETIERDDLKAAMPAWDMRVTHRFCLDETKCSDDAGNARWPKGREKVSTGQESRKGLRPRRVSARGRILINQVMARRCRRSVAAQNLRGQRSYLSRSYGHPRAAGSTGGNAQGSISIKLSSAKGKAFFFSFFWPSAVFLGPDQKTASPFPHFNSFPFDFSLLGWGKRGGKRWGKGGNAGDTDAMILAFPHGIKLSLSRVYVQMGHGGHGFCPGNFTRRSTDARRET